MEGIHSHSANLAMDHFGLALEAFYRTKSTDIRNRDAISAILHSYCGLESAVNLLGHNLFFNPESRNYVKEEKRDFPLKKMLKSWNASVTCIDKLEFLLSLKTERLEGNLKNQLIELNNLRNWISHGTPYILTYLVQPTNEDKTSGIVIDYEYDVDWKKKFPVTKFSPIDHLNKSDAEKALRIVFATTIKLTDCFDYQFFILTGKNDLKVIQKNTTIEDLIKE